MFARGGILGRVNKGEAFRQKQKLKAHYAEQRKRKNKRRRCRCVLPCMWPVFLAVLAGLCIMAGGCTMCVVGFYADDFSQVKTFNGTLGRDDAAFFHFKNLVFAGPVIMGIGCFIIVVAFVVVCEERDKVIKVLEEKERKEFDKKADLYDMVIRQFKSRSTLNESGDSDNQRAYENSAFEKEMEEANGMALQRIRSTDLKRSQSLTPGLSSNNMRPEKSEQQTETQRREANLGYDILQSSAKYGSTACLDDYLREKEFTLAEMFNMRDSWPRSSIRTFPNRHRLVPLPVLQPLYSSNKEIDTIVNSPVDRYLSTSDIHSDREDWDLHIDKNTWKDESFHEKQEKDSGSFDSVFHPNLYAEKVDTLKSAPDDGCYAPQEMFPVPSLHVPSVEIIVHHASVHSQPEVKRLLYDPELKIIKSEVEENTKSNSDTLTCNNRVQLIPINMEGRRLSSSDSSSIETLCREICSSRRASLVSNSSLENDPHLKDKERNAKEFEKCNLEIEAVK